MKTLFFGGNIITMNNQKNCEAVLIENDKIIETGAFSQLEPFIENSRLVDLRGRTLIPAFIDPHSHFSGVASSVLQASLEYANSFEQVKERIDAFIKENNITKGQWVNANNWDNNLFPGGKRLTLNELDSIAPENPLIIHHKSGHMGLLNSLALKALNIDESTPSQQGGKIEKSDGKLTGYLEENAFIEYIKKVSMPKPDQFLNAFMKAQETYLSYGITSVQDGMLVAEMMPLYDMLLKSGFLKIDLTAYVSPKDYLSCKKKYGSLSRDKHFKIGGIKIFLDGSPQGRTAWMRTSYKDDPSYYGYGTMNDDEVCDALELAAKEKAQLICHCNGDGAAEQFIRSCEKTEREYPVLKELRPVVIHGQFLGKDQVPRLKGLGAMVSFFIAHIYHWGDIHIENFGFERAKEISCAGTALKNNLMFTFHQDSPVIAPNMMETVWCAACRKTKSDVLLGEEEKIPVYDALCAVTKNCAYQYFEERVRGDIAKNKKADFVILSENPLAVNEDKLKDIKVIATYKDGKCVYNS